MFINNSDHITKMAAMPIYGKNLFPPVLLDRFQINLAYSIGDYNAKMCALIMTFG